MFRWGCTLAAFAALCACATGAPLGSRAPTSRSLVPFAPGAGPRTVPSEPERDAANIRPSATLRRDARDRVLREARALVGARTVQVGPVSYGSDCTAVVKAAFAPIGINLMSLGQPGDNGVTAMYRFAQAHGRVFRDGPPVGGDLIFFKDTYDQNRDGRLNDGLTHVAIVESIDAAGTVTMIHRTSQGVTRYRMNLEHPNARRNEAGMVTNDILRQTGPTTFVLTSHLFFAYASLLAPAQAGIAHARKPLH